MRSISRAPRSALLWFGLVWLLLGSVSVNAAPLMWRLDNPDSGARVYLFGALHYGAESFYPLPDSILRAYDEASILAVELDLEALSPEYVREVSLAQGYYSSGQTLSETLPPALWSELAERVHGLELSSAQLLPLKPWLAALQLVNLQLLESEFDQQLGLDRYFLQRAKRDADKEIHELETLEQQMALFSNLSSGEQQDFLAQTLKEFEAAPEQLAHLAQAWQKGDEQALAEAILGAFNDQAFSQHLYREVFVQRNYAMAEAVSDYLNKGEQVFFVVGVGHLLGEEGLVALLKARGYTPERL